MATCCSPNFPERKYCSLRLLSSKVVQGRAVVQQWTHEMESLMFYALAQSVVLIANSLDHKPSTCLILPPDYVVLESQAD